jgi:hypothetical protein
MNQIYRGDFSLSAIVFDLWHFFYQNFELQLVFSGKVAPNLVILE